MKKVLWISPLAPYDKVAHAGGKAENYFLKGVHHSCKFHLDVITCYTHDEKSKLDLDKYKIRNMQIELDSNKVMSLIKKVMNAESVLNPWNRNACMLQNYTEFLLKRAIRKYSLNNAEPDVVVLEWTEVVLLQKYVRKVFPKARILAIEEDVSFLGYKRKVDKAESGIKKWCMSKKYHKLKQIEIEALQNVDKIMVYNKKDAKLLLNNSISEDKLFVVSIYYDDFSEYQHKRVNKDILFYGAMSRPENYLSAIWFIDNVFSRIEDKECRFVIIGANPPKKLLKYSSEKIQVLGFLEDVSEYFKTSLCLVAPLVLGAGIKVKILESLSSGIPVLTNDIGIEGIEAQSGKDYLHCKTPEDYVKNIGRLLKDDKLENELSVNGKQFIREKFNKEKGLEKLVDVLLNM